MSGCNGSHKKGAPIVVRPPTWQRHGGQWCLEVRTVKGPGFVRGVQGWVPTDEPNVVHLLMDCFGWVGVMHTVDEMTAAMRERPRWWQVWRW